MGFHPYVDIVTSYTNFLSPINIIHTNVKHVICIFVGFQLLSSLGWQPQGHA